MAQLMTQAADGFALLIRVKQIAGFSRFYFQDGSGPSGQTKVWTTFLEILMPFDIHHDIKILENRCIVGCMIPNQKGPRFNIR